MINEYDVIIIGVGAMGSATAYHLAQQNKKVLGIDRFTPPHTMGSSHGQTRIIREAYFEGPQYVPIIQRAYCNWEKLEKEYGQQLYQQTGGLMMGSSECEIVQGAKLSADLHHLPYEILTAKQIKEKFPAFYPLNNMIAIREPRAGILFPEKCIEAHIKLALKNKTDFLFNEPATSWQINNNTVCVSTSKGKYYAKQLLLTAGAWLKNFLPNLNLSLSIERQVLFWFEPVIPTTIFNPGKFPVFIWSPGTGNDFYGFPDLGNGIKIAKHHRGEITDPEKINRNVKPEETELIRGFLKEFIPGANGRLLATEVCMYTNTPDFHFRIFNHPEHKNVLAASICSGHGFKFSSAIGEILADLLLNNKSSFDLSLFNNLPVSINK